MSDEATGTPQHEAAQKLYAFVIAQIKAGASRAQITGKLTEMGVDENDAGQMVEKIHSQIVEAVRSQQVTSATIVPTVIGGLCAAIACGSIWGFIVVKTGYEIGYMAWAVGLAAGYN